ncbi:MAG: hypothetical protein AAF702_38790 [Chloroflexota bacterium]
MVDQALEILQEKGQSALIDFLTVQEDVQSMADTCGKLAMTLYNKEKDIANSILVSLLGIRRALESATALAIDEENAETAYQLRSTAKGIAFNLGANMWPGWNDPGISLSKESMAVGMEAAHTNLRLGEELRKEPLPLSRAQWLIGAHEMALGNMDAARERFGRASALAESVEAEADNLLCLGYAIMTQLIEEPDNQEMIERFKTVKADLASLEQGEFFITQLDTALGVFRS